MSEYVPCFNCTNDRCPRGYYNKSDRTYTFCDDYKAPKPTHADRIRNMSDEEMARHNVIMVRSSSPNKLEYEMVYRCSDKYETDDYDWALKHELDWLRQPAEEYTT